ncbi:MAG: diguanylate cyclase [Nevskia sp.]|nr:diguanylate cyclase [Nevskia sp.]
MAGLLALPPLLVPAAQASPAGEPPMARFTPDVDADQQNFAIAQDAASSVYLANGRGVLSFDGDRWRLIRLPNGDLARSLAFDGRSRIYVGGYNVFGYLERDDTGEARFHDLTAPFRPLLGGEDFADIWDVNVGPQGVFFRAVRHLFLYRPDGGAVRLWRYPGRFGAIAPLGGDIFLQFRGEGLRRFRDCDWQPVAGTGDLKNLIDRWVPLPGGGLLSLANDGRWRQWDGERVRDYPMPEGSPPSSLFIDGRLLDNGALAFAGNDGTVRLFDPQRRLWSTQRVEPGWLGGLVVAHDGGLLVAGNLALYRIGWPGAWSVIGSSSGYGGVTHQVRRWGERWFALADTGAFAAGPAPRPGEPAFRRLDWTADEAWDLLPLDAHNALFAESYKLEWTDGTRRRPLADYGDLYPRLLLRSRFDPSVVYVGTEFGVALAQGQGADWALRVNRGSRTADVTSLVETAAGEVWFGSSRDGVHRVRFAADRSRIAEDRALGSADGIAYGAVPEASVTVGDDGALVATTDAGLFRWNGERFERSRLDGLESLRPEGEMLRLAAGAGGEQWAYGRRHVYRRPPHGAWHMEEIGDVLDGGVETIAFDDAGVVLLGCTGSILRYDPAQADEGGGAPAIRVKSLKRVEADGSGRLLPLQPAAQPRFVSNSFSLEFRFALPDYRTAHGAEYQARLIGHDSGYSDWTRATRFIYKHLEPGDYTFLARARDSRGRISQTAPYGFSVVPPWYATGWARTLWALLLTAAVAGAASTVSGVRLRRARAAQRQLEAIVAERTRELETANRRLNELANLDGLTEVANRRGLDAWLHQSWQRCGDNGRPMALMVIDVDHFKEYNDSHGHLAGDERLKQIVAQLSHCLRRSEDMVGRYGGDEFVAVLPGAELASARKVGEAMRLQVRSSGLGTISVGIAARMPRPGEPVSALLHEADEALYRSKRQGRDRVTAFGDAA